jgi:hypothetical protein
MKAENDTCKSSSDVSAWGELFHSSSGLQALKGSAFRDRIGDVDSVQSGLDLD